jgi:hypothetical protein
MRAEQEIRDYRNDLYRHAIIDKQNGGMMADIIMVFVGELDWALGDREHDIASMLTLLSKRDQDARKLALI